MKQYARGMGLIEIVIGAAVITIGIVSLIGCYTIYYSFALANSRNVQAAYLAEEGLEVVSFFRDDGWTKMIAPLAVGTPLYLEWNGMSWATTTSPEIIDGLFVRKIILGDVRRDLAGKMVASGGTIDPYSRLVTVTVEYNTGKGTTTRSMATYITNYNGI